jgi:hypothetical protein
MATRLLRTNILAPLTGKCSRRRTSVNYYTHVACSSKRLGCPPRRSGRFDVVKTLLRLIDLFINVELIQSEDKFNDIKDALKALNKMDFDKLISSVSTLLRGPDAR